MNEKGHELLDRCLIASELEPTHVIRILKIVKRRIGKEKLEKMFREYPRIMDLIDRIFPYLTNESWKSAGYE